MSLKQKTIKGLFWSGFSQAGKQISQFIITIILARLLSPDDFGLLAMATVFVNFVMIFSEMGISSALIQKQDTHDRHYYSAFWLNIVVGLCLTLFFIAVSPLIARFYKKPELVPILAVISLNFFLSSFVIIQQTILTKEMDFRKLAIRDVIAVIIAGIVGVVLAYNGFGVWSLVFQSVIFTLANAVLLWTLSSWRPKFSFAIQDIKDIFNFSANLTGFQIANYFSRNIDQLLIGKFLGTQALGYYSLAYKIMLYPLQNISSVIGKVMFPAFAKIQDDLEKVRSAYLRMVKAISLISFPLMLGLFAVAPEFVNVFFGQRWEAMIIVLRIFCFCGALQSIGTIVGNIFLSQGRSDLQFKVAIMSTILITGAILIGLRWGINGVALCYTLIMFICVHFTIYFANKLINLEYNKFYSGMFPSCIIGGVMLVTLFIVKNLLSVMPMISKMIILVCFGLILYLILLIVTKVITLNKGKFKISVLY